MPLPLLLLGGAALCGLLSVGAAASASDKRDKAKKNLQLAREIVEDAHAELEKTRQKATSALEGIGRLRLQTHSQVLGPFARVLSGVHTTQLAQLTTGPQELNHPRLSLQQGDLANMEKAALSAGEVLKAGGVGAGAGALLAVGAYGATGALATAGTGTAISALSGVAATNATLAWLGGGSLAAGGLGVAGGMTLLGGIVAGPALLAFGWFMDSKAEQQLDESYIELEKAETAKEQMESGAEVLRGLILRVKELEKATSRLSNLVLTMTGSIQTTIADLPRRRTFWDKLLFWQKPNLNRYLTEHEKQQMHLALSAAVVLYTVISVPVIEPDGAVTEKSREVLLQAQEVSQMIGDM